MAVFSKACKNSKKVKEGPKKVRGSPKRGSPKTRPARYHPLQQGRSLPNLRYGGRPVPGLAVAGGVGGSTRDEADDTNGHLVHSA